MVSRPKIGDVIWVDEGDNLGDRELIGTVTDVDGDRVTLAVDGPTVITPRGVFKRSGVASVDLDYIADWSYYP